MAGILDFDISPRRPLRDHDDRLEAGESAGDEEDQGEDNKDDNEASIPDATAQSVEIEDAGADEVEPSLKRTLNEDAEYEASAAKKSKPS
ncbi:hypothetical protein BDV19DRAFT_390473 [Aspergillus venezuelensis]